MHEQNIDLLCEEANRLLKVNLNLLSSLQNEPGVLAEGLAGEKQTFDKNSIGKAIEVLKGEQQKLDRLEMVLAVVGTMKAGKSTTINAIVGTEVLPNRNRPMTAIPTLIRHTPGQHEPVLHFENAQPINNLIKNLKSVLSAPDGQEKLTAFENNRDMDKLLSMIFAGNSLTTIYRGADEIFDFLCSLNDLVRISAELDVEFPFSSYDEIHEIPVIEVEFASLKNMPQTQGGLTLLDTPGPNEAGQNHLRVMLREQLSKASAILAVLDYTQLKSDADADVRQQLNDTAKVAEGSIYALINKFDQKDRNGDSEEQVKKYVALDLMKGVLEENNVFPVSSRWGYLASRALHEQSLNGLLPDPKQEPWVEDFAEEALGRRWERKISDPEEVEEAAQDLWADSLFDEPLKNIIQSAHARAAILAVKSATDKLVDSAVKMDNFLGVRETALSKDSQELQRQISLLISDIENIGNSEQQTHKDIECMLKALTDSTQKQFTASQNKVEGVLTQYFEKGKLDEALRNQEAIAKQQEEANKGAFVPLGEIFGSLLKGVKQQSDSSADFSTDRDIIRFDSTSDAKEFVSRIENNVKNVIDATNKHIYSTMEELVGSFEVKTKETISQTHSLIDGIQRRMSGDGFSIELQLPEFNRKTLKLSAVDMFDDLIANKTETHTRRRRQSGTWGKVCGFFGTSDWGWESYTVTEDYFEVNLPQVKNSVLMGIDETFNGLGESIAKYVEKPINLTITEFFTTLRAGVEAIRGDLMQSCRDKEKDQATQADLIKRLANIKRKIPVEDSRALKQDVSAQLQEEVLA